MALRNTNVKRFSAFLLNPETSSAPHGPPRGIINRFVTLGLPPWAAWVSRMNRHTLYRLSDVKTRNILPKPPQEMDVIWLNERVRERVRTSRNVQNVYRQLKYPFTRTGIQHSDILDHWVQLPMVEAATFEVEKDGGFDNFILKRSGAELKSKYGERIRRHLLVRQKEIQKNFVASTQAKYLASTILDEIKGATSKEEVENVFDEYGITRQEMLKQIARRTFRERKRQQFEVKAADESTTA